MFLFFGCSRGQSSLSRTKLDTENIVEYHDLRRQTDYLLSLSLLQSRTRIGHMSGTPSFVFQTAPAVQVASLVKRDHYSAQQLLLLTIVTVVVTGALSFFTVSLSLSLFAPVLGSGPVVYLQVLFRVKDGLRRRPTHSLHTTFTAAPHTAHLTSRTRSCKFILHSAIARPIGDVISKRLEHPPLGKCSPDGWIASPPSAQTSTMRRFFRASCPIHTFRIVALHFLCTPKTTLMLGPASLFLALVLLP